MGKKRCLTCCIIILIIALVFAGALTFFVAYIPATPKLVEKFTSQGLTAVYVGSDATVYGTDAAMLIAGGMLLAAYTAAHTDVTFEGIVLFVSEAELGEEPETFGYLLITDSIKSAVLLMVDFYQDSDEVYDITDFEGEIHASFRGKAYFVGNVNAELALRKIIF